MAADAAKATACELDDQQMSQELERLIEEEADPFPPKTLKPGLGGFDNISPSSYMVNWKTP